MLMYSSNKYGKHRSVDVESLWVGDRLATELSQWELHAELTKMKCPRITENMNKVDMLFCLGIHQQELAEARRAGTTK